MKKLLALAMLLVLCTVLTGLLTGCKVSAANTMMVDDTPKVRDLPGGPCHLHGVDRAAIYRQRAGRDSAAHRPISDPRADPHRQS